jgi:hypothetical protein
VDSYNFQWERGHSQFHQLHRFVGSILYEIPVGPGKKADFGPVGNAIVGGWQLGSIVTFSTGTPIGGGNCPDLNSNSQGNRGDATGISPFPDNPTAQEYYTRHSSGRGPAAKTCDVPVFIDGVQYNELRWREGNINRNMYLRPGLIGWDFSAKKYFNLAERIRLQLRYESFNFPNHPNWNAPSTGRTSANYGVITSARTMRTNQLALKLTW